MTPEEDLLDTIEQIRRQRFPSLPTDLIERIVSIERKHTDDRQQAYKQISVAVDEYLEARAPKKAES